MNGSPAGNGSASGIADFDQVATSIQQLFRSLDGPPRKLYEENLPDMVVEQIAQSFPVDLAVLLLKTDDGVRTMGSVGPKAVSKDALDHAAWDLIEDAASSGPRLVYLDELRSLAGTGLEREENVSLALVPLVRDQVGFGVLLTGRRQNGDGASPSSATTRSSRSRRPPTTWSRTCGPGCCCAASSCAWGAR